MPEAFDPAGATAVVTGASGDIGAAVARTLARRGAAVVLSGRDRARLDEVAAACRAAGGGAVGVAGDLTRPETRERLVAAASARPGGPDLLVGCAGLPRRVAAPSLTLADVRETIEINYVAAAAVVLALLPGMLARGRGHIVTVGSLAGRVPPPREAAYAASKHALAAFSDGLATDLAGTGVGVHLVTPAVVDTRLWRRPGQEPASVRGSDGVAAQEVADAVMRLLRTGRYEAYVPRRHRLTYPTRALLGRWFLVAARRFDRRRAAGA